MKILVAPDSFKGSLSAVEAANAMERGLVKRNPWALIKKLPVADGGEGTTETMVKATGGKIVKTAASDPLGRSMDSFYGILGDRETVVIEVAASSGFTLLAPGERNPCFTSSFGTGQLIRSAVAAGYKKFFIGLGGSATNDGGAGILQALGAQLLDKEGKFVERGGVYLKNISRIDTSGLMPELKDCTFTLACDVTNPLTGPEGASFTFGPQKGATPEMIQTLEANLKYWGQKLEEISQRSVADIPGTGAAGGIGAVFLAFFNAALKPGFELIASYIQLNEAIRDSDLVITGEGQVDQQTLKGKTVAGVIRTSAEFKKPVYIIAGNITLTPAAFGYPVKIISVSEVAGDTAKALEQPSRWVEEAAASIIL